MTPTIEEVSPVPSLATAVRLVGYAVAPWWRVTVIFGTQDRVPHARRVNRDRHRLIRARHFLVAWHSFRALLRAMEENLCDPNGPLPGDAAFERLDDIAEHAECMRVAGLQMMRVPL